MTTDLCPTTSPHGPHRRDLGPFGVRDCPGVTDTAPAATVRPLPVHGDAHAWQTTAIDLANQLAAARSDLVDTQERLHAATTALTRIRAGLETVDRALAAYDDTEPDDAELGDPPADWQLDLGDQAATDAPSEPAP